MHLGRERAFTVRTRRSRRKHTIGENVDRWALLRTAGLLLHNAKTPALLLVSLRRQDANSRYLCPHGEPPTGFSKQLHWSVSPSHDSRHEGKSRTSSRRELPCLTGTYCRTHFHPTVFFLYRVKPARTFAPTKEDALVDVCRIRERSEESFAVQSYALTDLG